MFSNCLIVIMKKDLNILTNEEDIDFFKRVSFEITPQFSNLGCIIDIDSRNRFVKVTLVLKSDMYEQTKILRIQHIKNLVRNIREKYKKTLNIEVQETARFIGG